MGEERIDVESLPFSPEKQRAVLGHVIYDEIFFGKVVGRIDPEWFTEPLVCRIYDAVKKWYLKWGKQPSVPELLNSPAITALPAAEIVQIQATVASVKNSRQTFAYLPLLEEMEIWLKTRLVQLALPKACASFNRRRPEESISVLNQMVQDYHSVRFLDDGQATFDTMRDDLIRENITRQSALTFGLAAMDRLLDPLGKVGGMFTGDMTVLLAPTNVGKTSALVTVACANIRMGRSVLFVSHEGRPEELKHKFMRCLSGMNSKELLDAYMDAEKVNVMRGYEQMLKRFLVYVPMNKPGLTIEEVVQGIGRYQDQRRLSTGKGFDILIDDYPAKLTTGTASQGHLQLRHVHEIVYGQFVQMGIFHNFHVLVAVQTNREGSKVNRKQGDYKRETRLLHMEDVMESWGVMTAAATVISINRTAVDAERKKLTYLLCKSRSGETGWAVVCNTDYDRCRTHSNSLGAFWYRGEDGVGERSSDIMNAFKDRLVTSEKMVEYQEMALP